MNHIEVQHYGIHWSEGPLAFLEQGQNMGSYNSLKGRVKTPFRVVARAPCNHTIPVANPRAHEEHQKIFDDLKNDPLVQAMLPVPRGIGQNMFFVTSADDNDDLFLRLTILAKLSSPVTSPVKPFWMTTEKKVIEELGRTNVQPLVLTGLSARDTHSIARICSIAQVQPRTLILVGGADIPVTATAQRIDTDICSEDLTKLAYLPWETLGASEVKYYMQSHRASKE